MTEKISHYIITKIISYNINTFNEKQIKTYHLRKSIKNDNYIQLNIRVSRALGKIYMSHIFQKTIQITNFYFRPI